MDIDLAALRAIEREKEIPFDFLVRALEDAMLNAYDKTEAPVAGARVELDRKSGRVTVLAPELDEEGEVVAWYDDTPADFGRVAASTARQVIFQRLREAEDEQKY
ncbi:MAG TPA: NusA N-terminal domain-containing protein, partial [Propionibacteriaceae bacterium]|nr:NusA N-terminal domain-containing protein [Propionibacteriaceae bacterium]